MQTLIELAPLIAFFGAYKFYGIYVATAVLMGAMLLLLGWDWLRTRQVPKMHLISAILVWVFGTATLLLHDVLGKKDEGRVHLRRALELSPGDRDAPRIRQILGSR